MPSEQISMPAAVSKDSFISSALPKALSGTLNAAEKLRLFMAVHFRENEPAGSDGRIYTGAFQICEKKGQSREGFPFMKKLLTVYTDTACEYLRDFRYKKRGDMYITANCMKDLGARSQKNLFSLNNIVIDIDAHGKKEKDIRKMTDILETCLTELLQDEGLSLPNTIVHTGRGLQLWWNIRQLPASMSALYVSTADRYCEKIERIIDGVPSFAGYFSVDRGASKNTAGLFRLPGSWNSRAGRAGTYRALHDRQLDLLEEDPEYKACAGKRKKKTAQDYSCRADAGWLKKAAGREAGLSKVIVKRSQEGTPSCEMRDLFFLCLVSSYSRCLDEESIKEKLKDMNSLFCRSMDEKEMLSYMSAAFRKKYIMRDDTIARLLSLTPEEQELSGIYMYDPDRSGKKKAAKEGHKKDRKRAGKKALSLYRKGMTIREAAERTGCPSSTLYELIKRKGAKRKDPAKLRDAAIIRMSAEGLGVTETAHRAGCSRNTVMKVRSRYAALISMLAEKQERGRTGTGMHSMPCGGPAAEEKEACSFCPESYINKGFVGLQKCTACFSAGFL